MSDFPSTLHNKMDAFEESLTEVEDVLKPFLKVPIADLHEKITDHLGKAKLDLIIAYTANSLFWTYLVTQGIDPKNHPIKDELIRIKQCMSRVKSIEDKKKMSRIDTKAAKRFVTSSLWEPDSSISSECVAENTEAVIKNETESNSSSREDKKRKKVNEDDSLKKKKKKKKKKVNSES